jgi:hypothetical protein
VVERRLRLRVRFRRVRRPHAARRAVDAHVELGEDRAHRAGDHRRARAARVRLAERLRRRCERRLLREPRLERPHVQHLPRRGQRLDLHPRGRAGAREQRPAVRPRRRRRLPADQPDSGAELGAVDRGHWLRAHSHPDRHPRQRRLHARVGDESERVRDGARIGGSQRAAVPLPAAAPFDEPRVRQRRHVGRAREPREACDHRGRRRRRTADLRPERSGERGDARPRAGHVHRRDTRAGGHRELRDEPLHGAIADAVPARRTRRRAPSPPRSSSAGTTR